MCLRVRKHQGHSITLAHIYFCELSLQESHQVLRKKMEQDSLLDLTRDFFITKMYAPGNGICQEPNVGSLFQLEERNSSLFEFFLTFLCCLKNEAEAQITGGRASRKQNASKEGTKGQRKKYLYYQRKARNTSKDHSPEIQAHWQTQT